VDGDYLTCLSVGLPDLQEEIAKCILICANCHRKLHAHLRRGGECPFWKWDPTMSQRAPNLVAAARHGIQRRKELGFPESTHNYGIEEGSQRKYLNLMHELQREITRRAEAEAADENSTRFAITPRTANGSRRRGVAGK
jgi:hypothetical protein